MKFFNILALATAAAAAKPTVYFIRHGEKPANEDDHGLSAAGMKRSQCLRNVFGRSSAFNIGHIMAETPKADGSRSRPRDTVAPLAADLGLSVDTSCDQTDGDCVRKVVKKYTGKGNILICWEHHQLNNLVKALGGKMDNYPGDHFDIIWVDPSPYNKVTQQLSEHCPGLDN